MWLEENKLCYHDCVVLEIVDKVPLKLSMWLTKNKKFSLNRKLFWQVLTLKFALYYRELITKELNRGQKANRHQIYFLERHREKNDQGTCCLP